jgi:hypothetical protein
MIIQMLFYLFVQEAYSGDMCFPVSFHKIFICLITRLDWLPYDYFSDIITNFIFI